MTGIDYLGLLADRHAAALAERSPAIDYPGLVETTDAGQCPGQPLTQRRKRQPISIEVLQAHYGFTRMPFGRALAPGMLHRSAGHGEAVARIAWCIAERALG